MIAITPILLVGSIALQNGGLTTAVFSRANALSECTKEVIILTFSFHRNFDEILEEQYKRGKLNKNVRVYNLFKDLDPKQHLPNRQERDDLITQDEPGIVKYMDENLTIPGTAYRYFNNGVYVKYKRFDTKGKIVVIDYFSENWRRKKQEIYDEHENLIRDRYMDLTMNKPRLDRYLSKDGECYLSVTVDMNSGKNNWFYLHTPDPIQFSSIDELLIFWINRKLENISSPLIMCDKREHVNLFKRLKSKNLRKFFVLHGNHFAYPHTKGSPVDPSCHPLFENLNIFEKVVILTSEQKKDIVDEFGNEEKFKVISHPVLPVKNKGKSSFKPHHAVTIARYAGVKALDEAINAFKYVVEEIPDATYSIYGYGDLKGELQKLIDQLGLQNNVFLEGFTTDPQKHFQQASCSILTSKYEGFGLVLTESMSVGTPVVSYNTKYGPGDIVRDGIDGYLVEQGDRRELANKIIEIMESKELRNRLSRNALEVTKRFNYELFKEKWCNLLQ